MDYGQLARDCPHLGEGMACAECVKAAREQEARLGRALGWVVLAIVVAALLWSLGRASDEPSYDDGPRTCNYGVATDC